MTPAERARQIDRQEFEAECAAIRQRAYALPGMKRQPNEQVECWIKRKEPKGSIKPKRIRKAAIEKTTRPRAANAKLFTAFGHTRTLREWAEVTGISQHTIRNRLEYGWTIEDALTRTVQPHRKPGVSSNFAPLDGTGAGSTLQESPEITFSEKT